MGNSSSAEVAEAAQSLACTHADNEEALQALLERLLPDSVSLTALEVFSAIQPEDVRRLREEQPRNLARLILEAVGLVADHAQEPDGRKNQRTLNAVRVLTRLMPVILEEPDHPDDFVNKVFWENYLPAAPKAARAGSAGAAISGTATVSEAAVPAAPGATEPDAAAEDDAFVYEKIEDADDSSPLGTQLVYAVLTLLACPELTVDTSQFEAFVHKINALHRKPKAAAGVTAASHAPPASGAAKGAAAEGIAATAAAADAAAAVLAASGGPTSKAEKSAVASAFSAAAAAARRRTSGGTSGTAGSSAAGTAAGSSTVEGEEGGEAEDEDYDDDEAGEEDGASGEEDRASGEEDGASGEEDGASGEEDGASGEEEEEGEEGDAAAEDVEGEEGVGVEAGGTGGDDTASAAPGPVPDEANAVWPMLLWKGGVGFPGLQPAPSAPAFLAARVDLLRLLLALAAGPLYAPPQPSAPARSRFLDAATGGAAPFAPCLFYSLLNEAVGYDPVGWGVPYASALLGDREEPLVSVSLQALLVLLDYAPLVEPEGEGEEEDLGDEAQQQQQREGQPPADGVGPAASSAPTTRAPPRAAAAVERFAQFNVFRSLLAGLSDAADFSVLYAGLVRLLASVPAADAARLPGAVKGITAHAEVLVLLWKLLEENPAFARHVLTRCDVTAVLAPVLYIMWTARNDVARVGEMHLCTFLLLLLSGERAFGVGLNRAYGAGGSALLPGDIPLSEGGASHADLLIVVLHRVVVDGLPRLSALYSCFLTVIANASPYAKGLSLAAAAKLVALFDLFSAPKFLFARPGNVAFVQQLVDTVNNIVQYQYESNPVLIYTLLRRREVFERLARVNVSGWRAQLSAAKQQRLAAAAASAAAGTAVGGVTAPASPAAAEPPLLPASPDGWEATDGWWEALRAELPLGTVLRLVAYLQPLVEQFVTSSGGAPEDTAVVEFIRATTVVGILPVPHAIMTRRYQPNAFTATWFTTFLWSAIFLHLMRELPMFDAERLAMFEITVTGGVAI